MNIFDEEKGLSPAIASILMVALTVVAVGTLAQFIGGVDTGNSTVSASIGLTATAGDNTIDTIEITHNGGDTIVTEDLAWRGNTSGNVSVSENKIQAGDVVVDNTVTFSKGDSVKLVYTPANQVLATTTAE